MTDEQKNIAQDILDGLLRDAYSRGFADGKSESESIINELKEQNKEMLEALKVSETEIKCQQLEADFNYNQCHGLPHPTLEQMEREEKWCDEVYMIRELIKRIEGEQE